MVWKFGIYIANAHKFNAKCKMQNECVAEGDYFK